MCEVLDNMYKDRPSFGCNYGKDNDLLAKCIKKTTHLSLFIKLILLKLELILVASHEIVTILLTVVELLDH